MKKTYEWFDRLVDLIKNDGRSMSEISKLAGCGQNYIQQMINTGRRPTVDKLLKVLEVLGGASAVYVLLGYKISKEDLELLLLISEQKPEKIKALKHLLDLHP